MNLEQQLASICERLCKIEATMLEDKINYGVSVEEFDLVKRDIGMIDPVAMYRSRNKSNIIGK